VNAYLCADNSGVSAHLQCKAGRTAGIGTILAAILGETNIFFSFLKVLWLLLAWRVPSPP